MHRSIINKETAEMTRFIEHSIWYDMLDTCSVVMSNKKNPQICLIMIMWYFALAKPISIRQLCRENFPRNTKLPEKNRHKFISLFISYIFFFFFEGHGNKNAAFAFSLCPWMWLCRHSGLSSCLLASHPHFFISWLSLNDKSLSESHEVSSPIKRKLSKKHS